MVLQSSHDDGSKPSSNDGKKVDEDPRKESKCHDQEKKDNVNSTNNVNAASTNEVNAIGGKTSIEFPFDQNMFALEDYSIFDFLRDDEDDDAEADMNNLDSTIQVSPILSTRIHKDHPRDQVIGDLQSATQTRKMSKNLKEHGFVSTIQQRTNYKDLQNCLFACLLSQEEPKKVIHALKDPSWIEAMQEELLQFKLQRKVKTASIPIETSKASTKDVNGVEVDVQIYQVNQKVLHLYDVKRIFRYLKGQPKLGLWYPKDSPFDLVAYTNSDYAGASLDRKSTTGGCQFLGCRLISWQCKKQTVVANSITEAEYVAASSCCGQVLWIQNQLLDYGYNFMHTKIFIDNNRKAKKSVRLMMEKLFGMELELILCLSPKTTAWNKFTSTMACAIICLATNQKFNFSKFIFESMIRNLENLSGNFLMYPRKPKRKDTQVPQPSDPSENVVDETVHKELGNSLVRGATTASSLEAEQDSDEEITLVSVQVHADKEMFDVDALNGEEVFVARQNENVVKEVVDAAQVSTSATTVIITTEEITLAQALEALKTSKPKVKGIVFQESGKSTTTTTISSQQSHDKGKGIMIEEPVKPMEKKVQFMLDEETALKLQAEFDEEERLTTEKAEKEKEDNIALIEEWDDIQAKIDVDHQLAERMQAQKQEELSVEEKAALF
ncbi:hypothetical protein Tco_0784432 [Tanacetum coccineum]